MTGTSDSESCTCTSSAGGLTPVNPYYALRYQFGMLLGVDDFEGEQAFHRGKMRLHNAWLHGEGVVWGLDVQGDVHRNEIKVLPGLALDAAGRELHLDATACLDATQWYAAHKSDAGFTATTAADGTISFSAYVTIAFKACLTRPVPAMVEPCQPGGASDTACSRVYETVSLAMVATAPDAPTWPYKRLRQLFSLDPDDPQLPEVTALLNPILSLPVGQQPSAYLKAFRELAVLDELDLQPATGADGSISLFPATDDTFVELAAVSVTLSADASAVTNITVDTSVRPVHVATSTIQELLCGPASQSVTANAGPVVTPEPVYTPATGAGSATIAITVSSALAAGSVVNGAFSVTFFDPTGAGPWQDLTPAISSALADPVTGVTLNIATPPGAGLLRLIVKGTGPTPVMGINSIPLGGASTSGDGADFVWIKEIS